MIVTIYPNVFQIPIRLTQLIQNNRDTKKGILTLLHPTTAPYLQYNFIKN